MSINYLFALPKLKQRQTENRTKKERKITTFTVTCFDGALVLKHLFILPKMFARINLFSTIL